jgi:hypothetical protein
MYPKIVASKLSISPSTPVTHKICKNCKHFRSGFLSSVEFGKCSKFGEQNLVDGTITYDYASVTRDYHCKGDYFEEQEPSFYRRLFSHIETIKNKEEQ